jgi:hypothetical protein
MMHRLTLSAVSYIHKLYCAHRTRELSSNRHKASSFASPRSACDTEDEDDCKEFCKASEQTATCTANGKKITCSCKGGKSESNCEERCLLCKSHDTSPLTEYPSDSKCVIGMPDKSTLEMVSRLSNVGASRKEEL